VSTRWNFGSDSIRTEAPDSCFDALSSREPVSTSLENALVAAHPAIETNTNNSLSDFLANPRIRSIPPLISSVITLMKTNPLLRSNSLKIAPSVRQGGAMSYTIGFTPRNQQGVSAAEVPTANRALAMIAELQEASEEIRFIRSPQEGDMGIEMLLLLAKEEAEEIVPQPGIWKPR
jgi:hypothetical protein